MLTIGELSNGGSGPGTVATVLWKTRTNPAANSPCSGQAPDRFPAGSCDRRWRASHEPLHALGSSSATMADRAHSPLNAMPQLLTITARPDTLAQTSQERRWDGAWRVVRGRGYELQVDKTLGRTQLTLMWPEGCHGRSALAERRSKGKVCSKFTLHFSEGRRSRASWGYSRRICTSGCCCDYSIV